MDIEQLTETWKQTHEQVEEIHQVIDAMNRVTLAKQTRWTVFRLKIGPVIELVMGGITAILAGGHLAGNWAKVQAFPAGAVPSALAWLFGVFLIWQSIWQLIIVGKLDYADDVTSTQTALLDLRKFRARCGQALLFAGITFWNIPPIALLQWIGSYDVAEKLVGANGFPGVWMASNVVVGLATSIVLVLIARRLPPTSAFNRFACDVFAGREVERAERELNQIQIFRASA